MGKTNNESKTAALTLVNSDAAATTVPSLNDLEELERHYQESLISVENALYLEEIKYIKQTQ